MADFTLSTYSSLLKELLHMGYIFIPYNEFLSAKENPCRLIILRHDVDLLPYNSLRTAEIEAFLGIKGTYYFRAVPESWNEFVITKIAELGHEIGYHYESLTTCDGDIDAAYSDFCKNLEALRKFTQVTTICMHGSPRSPYDSKDIWHEYSYLNLGIIGEPYLDTDFSQMFYLTDTGRRWDGYKVSVRDKIEKFQDLWIEAGLIFHSTNDIMKALKQHRLPDRIMITVHPQRWNPLGLKWLKEFGMQKIKNVIKRMLIKQMSDNGK